MGEMGVKVGSGGVEPPGAGAAAEGAPWRARATACCILSSSSCSVSVSFFGGGTRTLRAPFSGRATDTLGVLAGLPRPSGGAAGGGGAAVARRIPGGIEAMD